MVRLIAMSLGPKIEYLVSANVSFFVKNAFGFQVFITIWLRVQPTAFYEASAIKASG